MADTCERKTFYRRQNLVTHARHLHYYHYLAMTVKTGTIGETAVRPTHVRIIILEKKNHIGIGNYPTAFTGLTHFLFWTLVTLSWLAQTSKRRQRTSTNSAYGEGTGIIDNIESKKILNLCRVIASLLTGKLLNALQRHGAKIYQ